MPDAAAILLDVLARHADDDRWLGAKFERIKRLSAAKVGMTGQEFVERLCEDCGRGCNFPQNEFGQRTDRSSWDICIEGRTFELKTASEDVHGSFQFNHIRYHREYDALLCIGIGPSDIGFISWSKADVATGRAGTLTPMDRGSSATYKLTVPGGRLHPIDKFENGMRDFLSTLQR